MQHGKLLFLSKSLLQRLLRSTRNSIHGQTPKDATVGPAAGHRAYSPCIVWIDTLRQRPSGIRLRTRFAGISMRLKFSSLLLAPHIDDPVSHLPLSADFFVFVDYFSNLSHHDFLFSFSPPIQHYGKFFYMFTINTNNHVEIQPLTTLVSTCGAPIDIHKYPQTFVYC